MGETRCGVPEERWVDWHLGRLLPAEAAALARHREGCPACAENSRQWAGLLDASSAAEPAETPQGAGRERLRRRVRRRGAAIAARERLAAWIRRPAGMAIAGSAATLALFSAVFVGNLGQTTPELPPETYAKLHEPQAAEVMSRPDTVVYSMTGGEAPLPSGRSAATRETVWINARTHELFLLLEGMLPSESLDVQAWANYGGRDANLGLLQFHENQAHLYTRNLNPELLDSLALTMEPKGGSSRPTSPQSAELRFARLNE